MADDFEGYGWNFALAVEGLIDAKLRLAAAKNDRDEDGMSAGEEVAATAEVEEARQRLADLFTEAVGTT